MSGTACTVRTRKFMTNALMQRKQFVRARARSAAQGRVSGLSRAGVAPRPRAAGAPPRRSSLTRTPRAAGH